MTSLTLFLCVLFTFTSQVSSNTHDDVKDLLADIFTTNSYNKMVRPTADQTSPLNMFVDLHLVGITDIDEVQEKMTTTASLEVIWVDEYMIWNPVDYNGTSVIYVSQKDIWKPDIALENGFSKLKELGDDFILARIYHDGVVEWRPYDVFNTKCSIDITYFPFDKQTCDIVFGVWMSPLSDVDVELGLEGIVLDAYQSNGEWELLSTSAKSSESLMEGAIVTFSVTVKRKPEYILFNVVLPIIMMSLLSVFVFVLPVDCGEKMGYIMTVYLAFAVFLTIVGESLPVSSTMSLLSVYLIFLLFLGTAVVMITALELRIHYRDNSWKVPMFGKFVVWLSKRLRCKRRTKVSHNENTTDLNLSKSDERTNCKDGTSINREFMGPGVSVELTWPDVTSAIDFLAFWLFLVTDIIATIVIFAEGYVKSNK
ncbi:neuronal acetylcholine receptor subunit beta-3-like [Argopecten irradians]|uniref:neuronal acetylcholine receptor subunit beta-3-like n=1 Tax=Argopecten irradians TaxID=31199 RepID=UPI0037156F47